MKHALIAFCFFFLLSACADSQEYSGSSLPGGMDFAVCKPAVIENPAGNGGKNMVMGTVGGIVWLFDEKGAGLVKDGWPVRLNDEFGTPPAVIRNEDGSLSIGLLGMKGKFFIIDQNGKKIWETDTGNLNGSYLNTGDYDNDGKLDFAFGTPQGKAYIIGGESGGVKKVHPLNSAVSTNILALDWDEDGKKETIIKGDDGKLYFFNSSGSPANKWIPEGLPEGSSYTLLTVEDPDQVSSTCLLYKLNPKNNCKMKMIIRINQDGTYDVPIKYTFKQDSNIIFKDFNGDGEVDMLVTDTDHRIHVFGSLEQKEIDGFPRYYEELKEKRGRLEAADLDNDGIPDLVIHFSKENADGDIEYFITAISLDKGVIDGYPRKVPYNNGTVLFNDIDDQGRKEIILVGPPESMAMGSMPNIIINKTEGRVPLKCLILGREISFH